jgi:hypothetical protein
MRNDSDEEMFQILKATLPGETRDSHRFVEGAGLVSGIELRTTGWVYFVTRLADGWAIEPPNTSKNYALLVDQLMRIQLSIRHPA